MKKCQEWLQKNHKDLYEAIWSAGMQEGPLPDICSSPSSQRTCNSSQADPATLPNPQKP